MVEHDADAAKRQEVLKAIIRDLHAGADFNEIKARFAALIKTVKPGEIAQMEQALMAEGMSEQEITKLCDVHAALFQDAMERGEMIPLEQAHPLETLKRENVALGEAAQGLKALLLSLGTPPDAREFTSKAAQITAQVSKLAEVEKHYLKKENQLFPVMEKRGMSGPPKVMWSVHDETRDVIKALRRSLEAGDAEVASDKGILLANRINEMIFKEENILFPMVMEKLLPEDWEAVRRGSSEIGYALIDPPPCDDAYEDPMQAQALGGGKLPFMTGAMTLEQANLMLTHLPVDISFVDENDEVVYYTDTKDRIFPRSEGVIGRKVQDCHPPASVNVVNAIIQSFRRKEKDVAEFWLVLGGRFIHIRYFAVRDAKGVYRGVVEMAQDVTEIRKLEGDRRLLNW
jgi:uncharacterized protein